MHIDRLLNMLDDWKKWMVVDDHKLGFPTKSSGLYSGGAYTSLSDMCEIQDLNNVRTLHAVIISLPKEEQDAIFHKYLHTKKPYAYEFKLELAMKAILLLISQRIA